MGWAISSGWRWDSRSGCAKFVYRQVRKWGVFGLGCMGISRGGGILVEHGGCVVGDALSNFRICLVKRAV